MDSRWILRYLERMAELGLVPIVHAMDETPEESLWKLASVARSMPGLRFLALDAFGSYEGFRRYWKRRLSELRAGRAYPFTPLKFLVEDFRSSGSKGKAAIDVNFTRSVIEPPSLLAEAL